jgi:hypothetical protein
MNLSDDREDWETTEPSFTKWTTTPRSSTVIQSRMFRYRRSVFSTRSVRHFGLPRRNASISPKPVRPACFAVSTSTNSRRIVSEWSLAY